jgi:hypothetical protein
MTIFIRDDAKILYIHVPKTAGSSILHLFADNGFEVKFFDLSNINTGFNSLRTCSPQHYHAELLQRTLRLERFTYIFITVRHPLDRLKSEFLWRVRDPRHNPSDWVREILTRYTEDPLILDNHIRPQHEFCLPDAEVFRFERGFGEDWINSMSGNARISLSKRAVSFRNVAKQYCGRTVDDIEFDEDAIFRAAKFYEEDFRRFGYEIPGLDTAPLVSRRR